MTRALITGYTDLVVALKKLPRDVELGMRAELKAAGMEVQTDATSRFDRLSEKTARNFRTYVRLRGVSVEQALNRTTGRRPDWGALQMKDALIPALNDKQEEVVRRIEAMVDRTAALEGF